MAFCKITHKDYRRWQETGKRPNCRFHHHISPTQARQMEERDEAIILDSERAVIVYPCVESYVWVGKSSGGYQTLQLAPVT